ncbi:MAG: hypothetical protein ABR881_32590 [Candidatus Sulfotelmatobacter sp.]|jgi:hypothetical protein
MQTETENGKLMGRAIKAMLEMQSDCIKLFRDLDKELELNDLRAISGNTITTGLGNSITSPGLYLAQYLYRLYAPEDSKHHVLGVNICLHDYSKRYFAEPLFIAANVRYDPTQADESLATRSWDPWAAFLDWNLDRSHGKVLDVSPGRNTIKKIVVVAVPLYSITSIQAAIQTINLVGRPERDPRAVPIG